jgi:hypothetical protein
VDIVVSDWVVEPNLYYREVAGAGCGGSTSHYFASVFFTRLIKAIGSFFNPYSDYY